MMVFDSGLLFWGPPCTYRSSLLFFKLRWHRKRA